jgi:hypothetical protein
MGRGVGVEARGDAPDRLGEAIKEAAQKPAPPGKQRAVVVVATVTDSGDSSSGEGYDVASEGPL